MGQKPLHLAVITNGPSFIASPECLCRFVFPPTNSTGGVGRSGQGSACPEATPHCLSLSPPGSPHGGHPWGAAARAQPSTPIGAHTTSGEELSYPFIYKQINVK